MSTLRPVLGAPASALRGSNQSVLLGDRPRWTALTTGGAADSAHQSHEAYGVTCRDAQGEHLVPLFLDMSVGGVRIQDSLLWNLYEGTTTVDDVARTFCRDNGLSTSTHGPVIAASLRHQIATHAACAGLPGLIDVQVRDKNLPGAVFDAESKGRAVAGEQLHTISLVIHYGGRQYADRFEWDVLNPDNDPCEFARVTCADMGFPPDWQPIIAACVLEQVRRYQYAAARETKPAIMPAEVVAAAKSSKLPTVTPETAVRPPAIAKLHTPYADAVTPQTTAAVRSFTALPANPMDPRPLGRLRKAKVPPAILETMVDKTASFEPFRYPYSVAQRAPPHHRAKDLRPKPMLAHPFAYTEKTGPLRGVDYPA